MKFFSLNKFSVSKIIGIFIFVLLMIYLSFANYLLFHSLVEIFSIIIAFNIFIIVLNTLEINQNNYFLFLGVAYAFIGSLDLLHTLAYKGMGVFPSYGANLPTQLWVLTRYVEAISLLVAIMLVKKNLDFPKIFFSYFVVIIGGLLSIFAWGIFPDCFIPGVGLTFFKKISEYIIIAILAVTMILLYYKQENLNRNSYYLMNYALITTILGELAFTLYLDVYGLSNMIGHIFKVVSFYFIYKAIIETSFKQPYTSLFKRLNTANQQLQAERNKLHKYFEVSGVMIVNINHQGRIAEVNKKTSQVLGYNKEELVGQKWINFFDQEEQKRAQEIFASVPSGGSSILNYGQNEIITKSGARRKIIWTSNVLKDEAGTIKRILSSGLDITDHELLKEELKYNKLQVEFFANLSHELKTPLNLIFSALQVSDLYQKNNFSGAEYQKLSGYTEIIKQNSQRLLKLVNNLIDITKIDTNSFNLNLENVELVSVVEEITYSVENYIENENRILEFNSEIESLEIACDPFNIERILLNLLSNAIKFTEPGDKITVKVTEVGEKAVLSVKDTGEGIPPEQQDVIFDRFRQVDKSFKRNHEGSGIGLTIVKLLVNLHDGVIEVDSTYGEFTEFKIKLPHRKVEQEQGESLKDQTGTDNTIDRIEVEFSDLYNL